MLFQASFMQATCPKDHFAKQAGLKINTTKTEIMCVNATPTAAITASGETFELGSFISEDNGAQRASKLDSGMLALQLPDFISSRSQITTVLNQTPTV